MRCLAETIALSPPENMGRTRNLNVIIQQINLLNLPILNAEDKMASKLSLFRHLALILGILLGYQGSIFCFGFQALNLSPEKDNSYSPI